MGTSCTGYLFAVPYILSSKENNNIQNNNNNKSKNKNNNNDKNNNGCNKIKDIIMMYFKA